MQIKYINLCLVVVAIVFVAGCGKKKSNDYIITMDETTRSVKRVVEVQLNDRVDIVRLTEIAQEIKSQEEKDVVRTLISYNVGEKNNRGYWATTNFDPDLKVDIAGADKLVYEKFKNAPLPEGDVFGSWMVFNGFEYRLIAYKKNGKVYMQSIFADGSTDDAVMVKSSFNGKIKLQDARGKEIGEYYLVNSEGDLEFWSNNGNFYTAHKL